MDDKEKMIEFRTKLIEGLQISFKKLIAFKKYKNTPFIFSENGEIKEVYAADLEEDKRKEFRPKTYKVEPKSHLASEHSESLNKTKPK